MDDFDIPDDLKNEIEVIYLDDDADAEDIEEINENIENEEIQAEIIDLSRVSFDKHSGSVFSSGLSRDNSFAVTGGEDDMAYVWLTANGEIYLECTGHKDSVSEVGFNHDSQYVATGDMGGLIQVWNLQEKKLVWCYEGDDLEWLSWHNITNVLLAGSESGNVYMWQIPQGNYKVLPSHGPSSTCSKILPDGKRLMVGYSDGQVRLWDLKSASIVWQLTEPKLNSINSVDVSDNELLLAIAPTSQVFKVSDGKPVATMLVDKETEIEVASFNSELGVLATGSLSGQLCIWDMARQALRHQANIECSVTVLKWGALGKLFIGATDGAIYVCDGKTGTLIKTLLGHSSDILSLSLSKNDSIILSTSDDRTAKIFALDSH